VISVYADRRIARGVDRAEGDDMTFDPLTVWHHHGVGSSQPLSAVLTPDLSTAELIPDLLAAGHQGSLEPRRRWTTGVHRPLRALKRHRVSLRLASLTRATH
jgi:hypothetical protein